MCPTQECELHYHDVSGTVKPFPTDLSQWVLVGTRPKSRRNFPVSCGFYYSVQSVARDGASAPGGNVVRCDGDV